MILKEIGRKIAQAFRLAKAADEKVASSIAAALDAKAEQIKNTKRDLNQNIRNRILYRKHTHHWRRLDSVQQPPHMRSGDLQKA